MQPRSTTRPALILAVLLASAFSGAGVAVANAAPPRSTRLPRYTVTDLGTLGGTLGFAMGINDQGWVDGFSSLPDGDQHAFLWHNGVMTDLGTTGGPNSGVGFWGEKPNHAGLVAVTGETSTLDPNNEQFCSGFNSFFYAPATPYQCRPFVWQDGALTPLPTFGGNNGAANQINDRGQVVGTAETPNVDPTCSAPGTQVLQLYPALWQRGMIYQLPVLPGDDAGAVDTINDHGQAAGSSVASCNGSPSHAVLWQGGPLNGTARGQADVIPLGSLGGPDAQYDEATDINNQGQVVGFSSVPGNTYFHGFYWDPHTGIRDLGTLPGDYYSIAVRINDRSQVVGFYCDQTGTVCRAALWRNRVATDLNTLTSDPPLFLVEAFGINSRGDIVGLGMTATGDMHAFLARPQRETHPEASERGPARGAVSQRRPVAVPMLARELLWR